MTTLHVLHECTHRKLRLLCLHGMYQDAITFAGKIKHSYGISSNANVDFFFLDGPFITLPPILTRQSKHSTACSSNPKQLHFVKNQMKFRAWWRPPGILHQKGPNSVDEDRDMLINLLRRKLDEIGDVDGVVGFSQGASLAAWMCSNQASVELLWSPKIALLMGGYVGPPPFSLDSGVVQDISSLHVFGLNDYVIPAAKSQQVVDIFKQKETLKSRVRTFVHTQGHVIPKCDTFKKLIQSFLTVEKLQLLGSSSIASSTSDDVTIPNARVCCEL